MDKIYLTLDEIKAIFDLKLDGTLAKIRDRFLIGCVTGLRFSDYSRFNGEHLNGNIVKILTKKVNREVVIPAHRLLLETLERNNNILPESYTLRYYNMILKIIGSMAGINDFVKIEEKVEGTVVNKLVRKFELITTHTARRSFATNAYLAKIPVAKIMLITGHSTETAFFRYIRISKMENAQELVNHEFFK